VPFQEVEVLEKVNPQRAQLLFGQMPDLKQRPAAVGPVQGAAQLAGPAGILAAGGGHRFRPGRWGQFAQRHAARHQAVGHQAGRFHLCGAGGRRFGRRPSPTASPLGQHSLQRPNLSLCLAIQLADQRIGNSNPQPPANDKRWARTR